MVNMFSFWYFFFIVLTAGITVGLYFLLRNKSQKTIKIVLWSILVFNLALHFIKLLFPPCVGDLTRSTREVWFINICAASVALFPFIFISKSNAFKDYMFFMGVISGFLAVMYPTEALGKSVLTFDLWRFYFCHIIIFVVPLLTVVLKVHTLDYKRVWKVPFTTIAVFSFIMMNQVLSSEIGCTPLRGDKLQVPYKNTSLLWGPGSMENGLAKVFTWLTPNFMKTMPFGPYAGQVKYWPLLWLVPSMFVYFTIIPFIMCFCVQRKTIIDDFKKFFAHFKRKQVKEVKE